MTQLEYLVPETLDEALGLLARGVPLAGGSTLAQRRDELKTVIDLSKLGLDQITSDGAVLNLGAAVKFQAVVEAHSAVPETLREVCKREVGWNLRNMASLGGAIMSNDARSGLLTTLLALDARITQFPGPRVMPLHEVLLSRDEVTLITEIQTLIPEKLVYEQVGRSPADWPLVCAAIGKFMEGDEEKLTIALGGHGAYPIRLMQAEKGLVEKQDEQGAISLAQKAYANAGDKWASAKYRSEIAGVLVKRLLKEVRG